jgi:peptidoglycan hydrolase FlgJ
MSLSPVNAIAARTVESPAERAERIGAMNLAKGGSLHALSGLSEAQQIKAAAGQFEAIMLRQFLQESVSKIMGGEEGGTAGGVYGYMLTDVLAEKLGQDGGLGLSSVIEKQLTPRPASLAGVRNLTP